MKLKYVSRNETKEYKREMMVVLMKIRDELKEEDKVFFSVGLVGSAKRNLVLKGENTNYDVDIQLNLSSRDVEPNYREKIRKKLEDNFSKEWSFQNSTSVITAKLSNQKSFDIALIKLNNDEVRMHSKLIKKQGADDKWTWNEVKNSNDVFYKRKFIKNQDWLILRKEYKELKEKNYSAKEKDKKPSCALYVEAINNVYNHIIQRK